jgi:hypothetical protein
MLSGGKQIRSKSMELGLCVSSWSLPRVNALQRRTALMIAIAIMLAASHLWVIATSTSARKVRYFSIAHGCVNGVPAS